MTEFNLKKQNLKEDIFIFSLSFIMVLISINIIFSYVSNEDSKYLKKEVKKIENEIKQYEEQNKKLSEKIIQYESLLTKIDSSISVNDKKIDNLKINTNEKINSFKSYDVRMWEKYFADRYAK
jgi:uncharacterized protein YlxW (UPF0749 family)